jgi:hypothetical protein
MMNQQEALDRAISEVIALLMNMELGNTHEALERFKRSMRDIVMAYRLASSIVKDVCHEIEICDMRRPDIGGDKAP